MQPTEVHPFIVEKVMHQEQIALFRFRCTPTARRTVSVVKFADPAPIVSAVIAEPRGQRDGPLISLFRQFPLAFKLLTGSGGYFDLVPDGTHGFKKRQLNRIIQNPLLKLEIQFQRLPKQVPPARTQIDKFSALFDGGMRKNEGA